MSDKKYLSVFLDRLLPAFIREEYTKFASFIRTYLEYLEETGKPIDLIYSFLHYINIDDLEDAYDPYNGDSDVLEQYILQYINSFPLYRITDVDVKKLIKNAKDFYSSKGTEKSYDFIFRLMNHMGAFEFFYPCDHIMMISDANHTLDGDSKIHDNYYSAYYTYEIQSTLYGYAELKDIIELLLHPAGCKCFFLRIVESTATLDPVLQSQYEAFISFVYEIITARQYANFDTNNLIYEAAALKFSDLVPSRRSVGKMTFADWGDKWSNMEGAATNFEWYPHQLSAYITLL